MYTHPAEGEECPWTEGVRLGAGATERRTLGRKRCYSTFTLVYGRPEMVKDRPSTHSLEVDILFDGSPRWDPWRQTQDT